MKANVQYNDYWGTTAADLCDLFMEVPGQMMNTIFDMFKVRLSPEDYSFVGLSVNGTKVENMMVYLFLEEKATHKKVKCTIYSVNLQIVLDLFKRFEFQVGKGIENMAEEEVEEVEIID